MAASENQSVFDDFTENLPRAKRDLVLRFVKDQEALQTSQVDLKIVDDEILDLIESAFVAKGEDTKVNCSDEDKNLADHKIKRPLTRQLSNLNLDPGNTTNTPTEAIFAPRPPSGRPRARKRSSSRKVASQCSVDYSDEQNRTEAQKTESLHYRSRDVINRESNETRELNISSKTSSSDDTESRTNLKLSWPAAQQCFSRKYFVPLQKQLVCEGEDVSNYYRSPLENSSEVLRPQSSQSLQRIKPEEILTGRISSASGGDRITCNASSLTKSALYAKKLHKCSRGRTYINFNRLDAQVAFERPLGLEHVRPSDIPFYRSSSAASSNAPYAFVHVPPIGREGPAPSSS